MLPLPERLAIMAGVTLLGVIIGVVVTLHHRSIPPLGIIASLLVVGAFGSGLRLVTPGRGACLAGLLGMLAAQLILSAGSTNSVVVAQGVLGYAFTLGTVVVAVVVLAWPQPHLSSSR